MRLIIILLFLTVTQTLYGQRSFNYLLNNKDFKWSADSSAKPITIYYQAGSWTSTKIDVVKQRMLNQLDSVKSFMQINSYDPRIHLFIVESRKQMKALIDWESNGTAFYKANALTGIASVQSNSIFSNHELFHLIAMNVWGIPQTWINEGMAVYADYHWHGYDLYQLTNYLLNNNRYISLEKLIKNFRSIDPMLSYPLIGSFTRYLNETYGREAIINIWKLKPKTLEKITGKNLTELEKGWLNKVGATPYQGIKY